MPVKNGKKVKSVIKKDIEHLDHLSDFTDIGESLGIETAFKKSQLKAEYSVLKKFCTLHI